MHYFRFYVSSSRYAAAAVSWLARCDSIDEGPLPVSRGASCTAYASTFPAVAADMISLMDGGNRFLYWATAPDQTVNAAPQVLTVVTCAAQQ